MADVQMQETVSGFTFHGRWEAVVNKSEELSEVIQEDATTRDEVKDWEEWRPRSDESLSDDIREKTVEQACVEENAVEAAGASAADTAGDAVDNAGDAVGEVAHGNTSNAAEKGHRAAVNAALALDTVFRKLFRRVEVVLYRHVVTRTNPYYFDGETVSASLERKRSMPVPRKNKKGAEYTMSVEIHDDDVLAQCRDEIAAN